MSKILLSLLFMVIASQSEASPPPDAAPPSPASQHASGPGSAAAPAVPAQGGTLDQIRALIGNASCSDASQCRVLPIGARPCGGPEGYLAYSTSSAPEDQLLALAERHKQERARVHAESGVLSDCRVMPAPSAVCIAGTCQLAKPNSSAI